MNSKNLVQSKIQEILLNDWDPIGINTYPEAKNEYDSYVDRIYQLICSKKSAEEIFNYLWWIETNYIGLTGNKSHTKKIARKLSKLRDEVG